MSLGKCPICLSTEADVNDVFDTGGYRVACSVCGGFLLTRNAWDDELDPQTGAGHKLSAVCRARLSHRIQSSSSSPNATLPQVNSELVHEFVRNGCPGPNPAEQANNLIVYVGDRVSETGEKIKHLPENLYTIIGAPTPAFAGGLLLELISRGFLVGVDVSSMNSPPSAIEVGLTLSGWQAYQTEKSGKFSGKYGFIAMKFGDAVLDPLVSDHVKPVIREKIGYTVVDMRDVPQAGIIDNIMRTQIRDSAFVLVDLTHDNPGAYWEAGYAEGLGKPVIYICEQDKFHRAKTHFDTNHCTTVPWSIGKETKFTVDLVATLRRSLNLFEDAG